jgi:hypothetical protein
MISRVLITSFFNFCGKLPSDSPNFISYCKVSSKILVIVNTEQRENKNRTKTNWQELINIVEL